MSAGTGPARHARRLPHPSPALLSWAAGAVICPLAGCGICALSAYGFLTAPARTLTASLLAAVIAACPVAVRRARYRLWQHRCRAAQAVPTRHWEDKSRCLRRDLGL
jgi:hypothetical protein